ncbi:hypothetical protein ACHWQZ_G001544 [Mnemiopsis leidyi]
MLENKFKKNGKIYFDVDEIPKRNALALQTLTEVINCYNENSAQDEAFNQRRNEAVDDLKEICFNTYGAAANVYIFGSCINGFGTKTSDVDCFVMSNFDLSRKNSYYNPLLNSMKRKVSPFKLTNFVRRGNHPILTVKHKRNGMDLDITFSSNYDPRQDVLENSALLNAYAQKNVKVASVGRFIKYVLSKEPSLGSAKVGGLSSYAHIIMFIYFLLHGRHKISHVLVRPPYINKEEVIGASEAEIFLDFLRFYACELESSAYAIDIRDFDVKKIKSIPKSDPSIFTLEDPIIEKNLGKSMSAKRVYELKLFYYHLLCTLSNHKMNESQLMAFINELGEQGLSQRQAPKLHPLCDPDKENAKPPRDRKRQNRPRDKGASSAITGENLNQVSDAAPLDPAVESSHTSMQATGKNDTSKKNRRKNKFKKAETPVPRGHGQEAVIVPEGEVFLQNDPYLLEDMMKEIEMPEKETLPTPKSRPKKQMVNIKSETAKLAKAMLGESRRLETKEDWNVVCYLGSDVAGDSRCLVAVPLLATLGFAVPAIQVGNNVSLEKLKCIPGFNPELKLEDMNSMLEKVGCFAGYSQDLNLVESKMSTILKSVETLKSNQLDLARQFSLLAACGIKHCFGDVGCVGKGRGDPAFQRARDITNITKSLDIKCRVHVSDATVPYSRMMGFPLEVRDVVNVLGGEGSSDIVDTISLQCAHLLQMTGKVESIKDGQNMALDVLASGQALSKFLEMLEAQGVSRDTTDKLRERKFEDVLPAAPHQTKIEAKFPGIVRDIRLDLLERFVANNLGGYGNGGQGVEIAVEIGSNVKVGSCLAVVHHSKETLTPKQKNMIHNTIFDIEKIFFNRVLDSFRNDEPEKKGKKRNSKSGSKNEAEKDKVEVKEEEKDGISCTFSTESVPKDYVVVVNTENGDDQRTVIEKKE